jgi:hypothetical protein
VSHEIAYHLLYAEACALPIGSMSAYRRCTLHLARTAPGVLDNATQGLADDLERVLQRRARGLSLELLRQVREGAWFRPTDMRVDVVDHLVRVARQYLIFRGDGVELRPCDPHEPGDPVDLPERAARWRWLSLVLPADLLVAALCAYHGGDPTFDQVRLTTPHLRQLLDLPLPAAETHLHVGAAMPFALLWTGLMHGLTVDAAAQSLERLRDTPFGSSEDLHETLLSASIVRLLLHAFLEWERSSGAGFLVFERGPGGSAPAPFLLDIAGRAAGVGSAVHAYRGLVHALDRLRGRPASTRSGAQLARLYRRLAQPLQLRATPSLAEIILADPLTAHAYTRAERDTLQRGALVGGAGLPETRFAARALRYLLDRGRRDAAFRLLFLQYLRVRCEVFRYLVEEPGTAGMDWFSRHFYRVSPLRGAVDLTKYESALRTDAADLRLGSLEARTAPDVAWWGVRDEVRSFARQALRYSPPSGHDRPEIGLVLHFVKSADSALARGQRRLHGDPRRPHGARFARWYRDQRGRVLAIAAAFKHHPELLAVLRGIDVANLELAVPTWVVLPLLADVRAASVRAAATLARHRPRWLAAPMRVTMHSGEDYRRLIEGLRRIHEPVEFGLLGAGDRIGHGIALGVDPELWALQARVVAQPLEDRLDDLLWELERYGQGTFSVDAGRVEQVRAEAVRHAREIYDMNGTGDFPLDALLEARRQLHNPRVLRGRAIRYPNARGDGPQRGGATTPGQLLRLYLTDYEVFRRGQRPHEVTVTPGEVTMLKSAQRWLRRLFGRLEITVETNPSSNQLIGNMVQLEQHPIFRMRPLPHRSEPEGGSLLVSINVDNPITFASCLGDEYAYVYYALLRAGTDARAALEWLEGVRASGWRSRFTLPSTTDPEVLLEVCGEAAARRAGRHRAASRDEANLRIVSADGRVTPATTGSEGR